MQQAKLHELLLILVEGPSSRVQQPSQQVSPVIARALRPSASPNPPQASSNKSRVRSPTVWRSGSSQVAPSSSVLTDNDSPFLSSRQPNPDLARLQLIQAVSSCVTQSESVVKALSLEQQASIWQELDEISDEIMLLLASRDETSISD